MSVTLAFISTIFNQIATFIREYVLAAVMGNKKNKRPTSVEGYCHPEYESLRKSFQANFNENWESQGASLAVYRNDELVVDLWGGYADKKYNRLWKEDTLSTIFSTTKSITAMCFAIQVERGMCKYSDLVTKFWPEFGNNGKEEITIDMVLAHKAGLPYFGDRKLTLEDHLEDARMDAIIIEQKPQWTPGTKTGYHPMTFGWLCDAIFRRIDPEGRNIEQFFKQEIQEKHNIDVYIGDCAVEEYRVAHLELFTTKQILREVGYDRQIGKTGMIFYTPGGNFFKAMRNMRGFRKDFTVYNNPDLRIRGQPAVNGIATARGLAKVHQVFMEGHLVGKRTLEEIESPLYSEYDHSIGELGHKGKGWMYWKGPKGNWQYGHSGVGGQNVRVDAENKLVYAYLCNGMKAGTGEHVFTFNRLERKLYECFDGEKKKMESE